MLQQDEPRDFVIATGLQYSVRDFVEAACAALEMPLAWRGEGVELVGVEPASGAVYVRVDPKYFRPTEVETLLGDPTDARERLGWTPKTAFAELVRDMAAADLELAQRDQHATIGGFKAFSNDAAHH